MEVYSFFLCLQMQYVHSFQIKLPEMNDTV